MEGVAAPSAPTSSVNESVSVYIYPGHGSLVPRII